MTPLVSTAPLVSTEWLAGNLQTVRVVDASWYMPEDKRDTAAEFREAHIPSAGFFDIDGISDSTTDLPHMLPPPEQFADAMMKLGIDDGDRIVVYDGTGIFSAPRAWWMFKIMGHDNVAVLDGGLPKWKAEGRALEKGVSHSRPSHFSPKPVAALFRDFNSVKAALGDTQILDARSNRRFTGEEAEPRAGLKSGHMPGAVNVPWRSLLAGNNTLKDDHSLQKLFAEKGVDLRAPIITTCGSGISAAIVMLALEKIGAQHLSLYDGSWAEWGGRADAPVRVGA
jgi:thiosulfate/3-mercaptopyruvate sulfurtransferase